MTESVPGEDITDSGPSESEPGPTDPPIDSFFGEHRFLSNFWPAMVSLGGLDYPTVEHAYQAAKTTDARIRATIRRCKGPGSAKAVGSEIVLPGDWPDRRIAVMLDLLRRKFSAEPTRALLLGTGARTLIEGNGWGDRVWGVCNGAGANHLGNLLMTVRSELQGVELPILALDLEGTFVSNIVSLFVRPGFADFAEWSHSRFDRTVIYTTVPVDRARGALERLADLSEIPRWLAESSILQQVGPCKDLQRVASDPSPVLLVDDQADAVCPAQVNQWVPVESWSPPYASDDIHLADVRDRLDRAISQRDAATLVG